MFFARFASLIVKLGRKFHRSEEGGAMFSFSVATLGLVVAVGFTMNIASEAIERERMQHAADALAYSSATWCARGMNATAALNHAIAEKIAVSALIEATVGSETEFDACREDREMTQRLEYLLEIANYLGCSEDRDDIERILKNDSRYGKNRRRLGGAFYDAQLTLKYNAVACLTDKCVGQILINLSKLPYLQLLYVPGEGIRIATDVPFKGGSEFEEILESINRITAQIQSAREKVEALIDKVENVKSEVEKTIDSVEKLADRFEELADSLNGLDEELAAELRSLGKIIVEELREGLKNVVSLQLKLRNNFNASLGAEGFKLSADASVEFQIFVQIDKAFESALAKILSRASQLKLPKNVLSVKKEILAVVSTLSGMQNRLRAAVSAAKDCYNEALKLADLPIQLKDLYARLSALDWNSFLSAIAAYLLQNLTFKSNITVELDALSQLEIELAGSGKFYPMHEKRYELRKDAETLQRRFAAVVGADADNSLFQAMSESAEKIADAYGLEEWSVSPNDTLIPKEMRDAVSPTTNRKDFPLLPVLPESDVKERNVQYLEACNGSAWTNSTNDPVYALPDIPWQGSDASSDLANMLSFHNRVGRFVNVEQRFIPILIVPMQAYYLWRSVTAFRARERRKYRNYYNTATKCLKYLNVLAGDDSSWIPQKYGHPNNPSVWSYPVGAFDYEAESKTQLTRAAYPILDELRAGMRAEYQKKFRIANLSTYITAWSYRCLLSESYYARTGQARPSGDAYRGAACANYVYKKANDPNASTPCALYVIAGTDPANKGNEAMWRDPATLDEMFSISASVRSKPRKSIVGSILFKRLGEKQGVVASAQAMFYPANGRNEDSSGRLTGLRADAQPPTAWDVLQWKNQTPGNAPTFESKEWGTPPSSSAKAWSFSEAIKRTTVTSEGAKVELSWKAMLVPMSKSRSEETTKNGTASDAIKNSASVNAKNSNVLQH